MSRFGTPSSMFGTYGAHKGLHGHAQGAETNRVWEADLSTYGHNMGASMNSPADPETLARALRAHKAGDAVTQAMLTLSLMLAIGVVAMVVSVERASAAGFLMRGVTDHLPVIAALALVGTALLFATRTALREIRARAERSTRR
ncbi:hypothetical protein ACT6QH_03390 [Xanthobacter sp. TB0139]|uniref:hypothetical protein n=1 Tax=Xanthobacter sp. TB0139 TaxID=3459178 RepID=UPI00403A65C7